MKSIELLSPAKNLIIGIGAIDAGADAVYMGAKSFGARVAAGNSIEEIKELIDYAHIFNVKIYVTLNTILYDSELKEVEELIHSLYEIGVDAIIIQDMGILEMNLPPITLHASTQTHNLTKEKVRFFQDIGFKRLVLARELSINEIREISNFAPNIEIESFVHGALCSGLSGKCYLSYFLTKRSGNRGECSQPCRSKYDLIDSQGKLIVKNKHLLSTKDFNASGYIPEMINAGVTSFKIEGRLKDLDYVKNITAHYSKEINKFINSVDNVNKYSRLSIGRTEIGFEPDIERSFNRGFTTFNLVGKSDKTGNPNTAKAIGKFIGIVTDFDRKQKNTNYIELDTKEKISNADGLCFFNKDGELEGFLVNGVERNNDRGLTKIYTNKRIEIRLLSKIYRNFDIEFSNKVEKDRGKRKIGVDFYLNQTDLGFILRVKDENALDVETSIIVEKQIARNLDSYHENLYQQISKLGNSPFYLKSFTNNCDKTYFFPNSIINSLRRNALDKLLELRKKTYIIDKYNFKKTNCPYPEKKLDYSANISNHKAIEFYLRHGVEKLNSAMECSDTLKIEDEILNITHIKQKVLMRSKNCILYNLGLCKKDSKLSKNPINIANMPIEPLFLRDNSNTYELEFDCINCFMNLSTKR